MNDELAGAPAEVRRPAAKAAIITRWCIMVTRADGTIEILSTIYHTQAEAVAQTQHFTSTWRGVTVRAAKCQVQVEGEPT